MYINSKMLRDLKDYMDVKNSKALNSEANSINSIRERQFYRTQLIRSLDSLEQFRKKLQSEHN